MGVATLTISSEREWRFMMRSKEPALTAIVCAMRY